MPVPPPRRIQRERCPILRFQGVLDCCMGTGKTRGTGHLRPLESKVGLEPTSPRRVSLSGFFRQRCSLWAMPRDCGSQRGLLKTHAALPEFQLDHFDSIHSLMDELLCVPLKITSYKVSFCSLYRKNRHFNLS